MDELVDVALPRPVSVELVLNELALAEALVDWLAVAELDELADELDEEELSDADALDEEELSDDDELLEELLPVNEVAVDELAEELLLLLLLLLDVVMTGGLFASLIAPTKLAPVEATV